MIQRLLAFARSRTGSAIAASVGLVVVALMMRHTGPHRVWLAISRSVVVLPLVFLTEGVATSLEVCGLRLLYGPDRHKLRARDLARASLIGYAMGGLMPAGRPVAEGVRGAILAHNTSAVRAAAAGTKLQSVLLLAQTGISMPCLAAAVYLHGPPLLITGLAVNSVITLIGGGGTLVLARTPRLAKWLGRLAPKKESFGAEFNRLVRGERIPLGAWGFAVSARIIQATQYTVLLLALGYGFSLARGLCAEGVHLVGATLGDLIPSHVGVTEGSFSIAADTLTLRGGDALAIPLVVHFVQLLWIGLGSIALLVWRRDPPGPSLTAESTP